MNAQDNKKSIIYTLSGMALFSIQDGLIKFIYNVIALYELYFGRTFVVFILLLIFMWFKKEKLIL